MKILQIDIQSKKPIYKQIIDSIVDAIKSKQLMTGDQIPSINEVADEYNLSKGTVVKAYAELKALGIIDSMQGKGFYIFKTDTARHMNIFMLFDSINPFKQIIIDSFMDEMEINHSAIQVFFHHYNQKLFEALIKQNIGHFQYYIIMPHFNIDMAYAVKKLPKDKTLIIDNEIPSLGAGYATICQSFEKDIYNALAEAMPLLRKYQKIRFILSKRHFQFVPEQNLRGFKKFCDNHQIAYTIEDNFVPATLHKGDVFIEYSEPDLIAIIKTCRDKGYKLGQDVGLISYDDTPLKEILEGGISVITTDFALLGTTAAKMIKQNIKGRHENPGSFISRGSL
ncbi:MAG: GntR family transcriptional regulator [Cytophagales bacterium]|nr:GntR family transcriptional regulator [Cytophagales bacterium]